jgi:hypothetical protein
LGSGFAKVYAEQWRQLLHRCAYMNTVVKADVATLQAASERYTTALEGIKSVEELICSFTLQPYAASLLQKSASLGGNSLGLDPADGPLVSILLLTYRKNKSDDEKILGTMKEVLEKLEKDASERETGIRFKYMNYAFSFQDPIASYGHVNRGKLREVSGRYDPEGLFQMGIPGEFKLFT